MLVGPELDFQSGYDRWKLESLREEACCQFGCYLLSVAFVFFSLRPHEEDVWKSVEAMPGLLQVLARCVGPNAT